MIIRVRFTSLFVYWDCLYITDLKINFKVCQGENTPFVETHARLDYGFCQDSSAGDLSVLSFVMTFTTMLSVISCVFVICRLDFSLEILDHIRVSTFPYVCCYL